MIGFNEFLTLLIFYLEKVNKIMCFMKKAMKLSVRFLQRRAMEVKKILSPKKHKNIVF